MLKYIVKMEIRVIWQERDFLFFQPCFYLFFLKLHAYFSKLEKFRKV